MEEREIRDALNEGVEDGTLERVGDDGFRMRPKGYLVMMVTLARADPDADASALVDRFMDDLAKNGVLLEERNYGSDDMTDGDNSILKIIYVEGHQKNRTLTTADIAQLADMPGWKVRDHLRRLVAAKFIDRSAVDA